MLFFAAFIILFIASAAESWLGAQDESSSMVNVAYYSLVVGIALQIGSFLKYDEYGTAPEIKQSGVSTSAHPGFARARNLAAIATLTLIVISGVIVYPSLLPPSPANEGTIANANGTGCKGAGTDGTIFLGSSVTVSIEICGVNYVIRAGQGGGLTFSYRAGRTVFLAPASVNSSTFEFWYAVIGDSPPNKVNTTTLSLDIPAGLTSQNALVQLFYSAPPSSPAPPTSVGNTTTGSKSFASTSSVVSASSISASEPECRGEDGSVFISTNIDEPVTLTVCGEGEAVTGGIGGGLDYSYRPGNLTLGAPMSAPSGKAFEYWFVILPTGTEKVETNQVSVYLPAGYSSQSVEIIANYG